MNVHVLFFGDLVGSLVDPLAAELVFLPETVLGLTAQGYDCITVLLPKTESLGRWGPYSTIRYLR
jgi:hypothetical protein